ncbi:hypothetical protein CCMA1212_003194 [Trichoderma ghanense]|uniref:Uncharacterized protein n=1 Tax=Trichoderma ghanense TaxID=65468 RepID=A0ABY2HAH2_9HYPO
MASPSPQQQQQQQQQQPPPDPQTAPQPPQPVHTPAGFQPLVYNAHNVLPYAPIHLPQQAFEAPEPQPNKPWELTKTGAHVLSVVLGATGIGLGFSTLNYEYFYAVVLISAIPPVRLSPPLTSVKYINQTDKPCVVKKQCMIALVWSLADLLVRLLRNPHRGIHPGAHVALSLIIFLLGAILPSLFGPWFEDSWNGDGDGSYPWQDCTSVYDPVSRHYDYTCTDDDAVKRQYLKEKRVATAAAVVAYIVAVIHFGLFVGACVDTDRVNRLAKRPIYVVAPPPPQMMQWQPMQQQYQAPVQPAPVQQAPMQQPPVQPPAQETPQTETDSQSTDKGKGKGKEPMVNPVVENDAPSGSQA